jgi:outer membrane protein assembly factor BamB
LRQPESLGAAVNFNCYASPSAVLEPGRVYVNFGSYGTACLDTATFKVLWQRDDLPCRHFRGPGSSPILWSNLLILTMDGIDLQYMAALDKNTGKTVWKTDRTANGTILMPAASPWAAAIFARPSPRPLLLTLAARNKCSAPAPRPLQLRPGHGARVVEGGHTGYSPASRPIFDNGLAIFSTGNGKSELLATRPDGHGELPASAVVWRAARAAPSQTSGTVDNGLLFMVNEGGIASCFQTADGAEVWRERIGGDYSASVLYGDGRIYCFSHGGKATVLKAGRTFESLATNQLASGFMASPAVTGRALILRTKTDLYRIEDSGNK